MNTETSPRWRQWLTVVLLGGALLAPLLDTWLELDPAPVLKENRVPREWPGWDWNLVGFPDLFEEYYQDHFGFRRTLIRCNNLVKYFALRVSPTERVTLGRDDWLFLDSDVEVARSAVPVAAEQLDHWRMGLESIGDQLGRNGAKFLVVVAPSSATVYHEILPSWAQLSGRTALLDSFLGHMQGQSDVTLLDLRPSMREMKASVRLYHRSDTHWNDYGAYAAYRAIIDRLREWYPSMPAPHPLEAFTLRTTLKPGGDLAGLLALTDVIMETDLQLQPKIRRQARQVDVSYDKHGDQVRMRFATDCTDCPTALMVHDSFTYAGLYPFLAEHFSRIDFYWRREMKVVPKQSALTQDFMPDVVLYEFAERFLVLDNKPPQN